MSSQQSSRGIDTYGPLRGGRVRRLSGSPVVACTWKQGSRILPLRLVVAHLLRFIFLNGLITRLLSQLLTDSLMLLLFGLGWNLFCNLFVIGCWQDGGFVIGCRDGVFLVRRYWAGDFLVRGCRQDGSIVFLRRCILMPRFRLFLSQICVCYLVDGHNRCFPQRRYPYWKRLIRLRKCGLLRHSLCLLRLIAAVVVIEDKESGKSQNGCGSRP